MSRPGATSYFTRYMRDLVARYPGAIALLTLNVVGRVGLGLWWPYANKAVVDRVLALKVFPVGRWAWLIGIGALVLVLNYWLFLLFNRLLTRLMAVVTQRLRTVVAGHLLRLSQEFYDASHAGRLLTVALADPESLSQQLTMGIINALANALVVLGGYVILVRMNLQLTLAISLVFPLMVAIFFAMRPAMVEQSERNRESWGILMGMVSEKVAAVRVIRSYATEDAESAAFRRRTFLHADLNVRQTYLRALYGSLNGLCVHLGYILVFLVGGWLYLRGRTTLGTLVAFYGYFNSLYPAVLQICTLPQLISEASGSLTKVYQLLDRPLAIQNLPGAREFRGPLKEVAFEGVWFRYGAEMPWALRDAGLRLRAGEQVGILGPSGSGKSTLMALLLRFYEPQKGRVLVNGRDLREWDLPSLRRAFGLVPQEPILFSGSIRDNLNFRRAGAGDGEVWEVLKAAEAEPFVRALPRGLDTDLGEKGLTLSGGQRQRLALARALLGGPELVILDNCTSALDGETEKRILRTLRVRLEGRSAFIISHRASAVMHCARLAVFDGGRVAEQGEPGELMRQPGYFRDIVRQQEA